MIRINKVQLMSTFGVLVALFAGMSSAKVLAQGSNASWTQCTDGRVIVRCETYDCPLGDTNDDGTCTLSDSSARLTDARNDSFCANPLSGCGVVQYFASGGGASCSTRVEENDNNCDLYAVANTNFTPRPSATVQPTASPSTSTTSQCTKLTITPSQGSSSLKVTLAGEARDPNGAIGGYEFAFRKGTTAAGVVEQKGNTLVHTFSEPGEYVATLTVIDSQGKKVTSAACQKTITVGTSTTKGGGDSEVLPETGGELWIGLALVAFGGLGAFMYDRFRTV